LEVRKGPELVERFNAKPTPEHKGYLTMAEALLIRHYAPELDLPALARVLTEIESIDRDGEDTSEEYLRNMLGWPNFRPGQDAWVAEAGGRLIGFAAASEQPSRRCTLYAVVHPAERRKGLGSQMLDLTLGRARELGSKSILLYANEHNPASNSFLAHHGFAAVGSSGAMTAPAELDDSPFEFPAGFALKRYSELNDPSILLAALDDCYLDMWGHQHNDQRSREEMQSPRFLKFYDPGDILLLFDPANAVSGICSLKSEGRRGHDNAPLDLIDAPGVIKKYRQEGYQHPLVLAGIRHLRERGRHPLTLEFWGEDEGTLEIYRRIGFEMTNRLIAYHKELP
jgi:mycothiol synthase